MSNPYYTNSNNIGAGGFARGDQVNNEFQSIERGFDTLSAAVAAGYSIVTSADSPVAAAAGQNYFVDVSTGAVTITLPAAPVLGDAPIGVCHVGGTIASNLITIARNGKPIMGLAEDMTVAITNANFRLGFCDNTRGWRLLNA